MLKTQMLRVPGVRIATGRASWRSRVLFGAAALLPFALLAPNAGAVTIGFGCISNNLAGDCAIGEAQLSVDVSDNGGGQVLFLFSNAGPEDSSITGVFFDDGTLLGIASLIDADTGGDPGVDFTAGSGTPPELPAGNTVGFQTTVGFLADSDPPVQPNGVNPLETLGVVFDLQAGGTLQDVIAELTDETLRIGIFVQGFAGGGSESFVSIPVPEPGTAMLLGLGLLALAGRRSEGR